MDSYFSRVQICYLCTCIFCWFSFYKWRVKIISIMVCQKMLYFELTLGTISIESRNSDFTIIWHLLRKWLTGYAFWLKGNKSLSGNPKANDVCPLRASADVSDSKLVAPYYWVTRTLCIGRDICSNMFLSHINFRFNQFVKHSLTRNQIKMILFNKSKQEFWPSIIFWLNK